MMAEKVLTALRECSCVGGVASGNEVARAAGINNATARRVLLELALEGKVSRTRKKCADLWALTKKGGSGE